MNGGYRLSGQWPFVSGGHDCHWFYFLPQIMDGDQPRLNDQGIPVQRFMFLPAEGAKILDTWHTLGCEARAAMTSSSQTSSFLNGTLRRWPHSRSLAQAYQGPLYRLTLWVPIALLAPPALGIARAAIDGLIELARKKTPSFTGSVLGQRQVVQRQVAEAEATLGAGRAYGSVSKVEMTIFTPLVQRHSG